MILSPEQHIIFNNHLIDLFKKCIRMFDKYNIQWFACGGTALGAIRHKDIIPWDDDIDLFVPRESYERLIELSNEFFSEGLLIESINNKGYNHSFMKIIDSKTTIWENRIYPISGLWIDIFPLDYFNGGIVSYRKELEINKRVFRRYQRGTIKYGIKNLSRSLLTLKLKQFFDQILSITYYRLNSERFRLAYRTLEKERLLPEGKNLVCYAEGDVYVYNREWFDTIVEMPFRDFKIRMPKGWHEYLTMVYGDYMTPPPLEKRIITHQMHYINLNERLTREDIKREIRKGNKIEI